jgi:predicted O-methyltransferase YrrM
MSMNLIRRISNCAKAYTGMESLDHRTASLVDKPQELVKECFSYAGAFLRPVQVPEEMVSLLDDVRTLSPKTVLEIGTFRGGTLYLWTRLAQPDATIVSVDLPGGKFGGGYSRLRTPIYRRFPRERQALHLLRANSHDAKTLETVKGLFGPSSIDFLFIDGDHTYEGVKRDWEMYSPLVRKGGLVAFHDVAGNYGETQVKRCWDEMKSDFTYREYMAHPDGQYGIGVLFK